MVNFIYKFIEYFIINPIDFLLLTPCPFFSHSYFTWLLPTIFYFEGKFILVLGFLIAIRVGTPRYRYDFLSKLGWLKLLSITLSVFSLVLFWIVS